MSDNNNSSSFITEVLSTDVILYHIFNLLDVPDLLNFRLVNQKWNAVASSVLKSKSTYISSYKLRGIKPGDVRRYIPDYVLDQIYRRNFEYLTAQIQNNSNFPFLGFTLDRDFTRISIEAQDEFAQRCGKYFRRLSVGDHVETERLGELLPHFSQIEYVNVGVITRILDSDFEVMPNPATLIGMDTSFPKLTCFVINKEYDRYVDSDGLGIQLLQEIIKASPKLRRLENFKVKLIETLIECGKMHVVTGTHFGLVSPIVYKFLDFLPSWDYQALASLKLFSENLPPLKSLDIVDFTDSVKKHLRESRESKKETEEELRKLEDSTLGCLETILNKCKNSLSHLRLDYLQEPPIMPNLKSICIVNKRQREYSTEDDGPYRVFDMEDPWESYFPSLETVRIELKKCTEDTVWIYFGQCGPYTFPTVSTLELDCPFDEEGIEGLVATFPNVTNLRVYWKKESGPSYRRSKLEYLWQFSESLKSLEIFDFPIVSDEFRWFDETMTGLCSEVCENLRKHPRIPFDPSHLNVIRTSTSILELKSLESFVVHFVLSRDLNFKEVNQSPISSWYAWELMPKLKTIKFLYDSRGEHAACIGEALKPYEKFVSILP